MISARRMFLPLALAGGVTAALSFPAHAQDAFFINPNGGLFEDATNFIPGVLPDGNDTVVFDLSTEFDVDFQADHTLDGLRLDGDTRIDFAPAAGTGPRRITLNSDLEVLDGSELFLNSGPDNAGFELDVAGQVSLIDTNPTSVDPNPLLIFNNNTLRSGSALIDYESGTTAVLGDRAAWHIDGDLILAPSQSNALGVAGGGSIVVTGDATLGGEDFDASAGLSVGGGGPSSDISRFVTAGNMFITNAAVLVGAGGIVESDNQTQVGIGANSVTTVDIRRVDENGNRATWRPGQLSIGLGASRSTVFIEDGGLLESRSAIVGVFDGIENSTVIVRGGENTATWRNTGTLTIGFGNAASVNIESGAELETDQVSLGVERVGSLNVTGDPDGPTTTWLNSGDVYAGGTPTLDFGAGNISLIGNTRANIGGTLKIWDEGRVSLNFEPTATVAPTLTVDTIDHSVPGGVFNFRGGTLHVNRFEGDLTNDDAGVLAPGVNNAVGQTTVTGDYIQDNVGVLAIDLAGTAPGVDHDFVEVLGEAELFGFLALTLVDSFTPDAGDVFTVLTADDLSDFSFFTNANPGGRIDTIEGLGSFRIDYGPTSPFDPNSVVLSQFESSGLVIGDYNGDGFVSQGDLDLVLLNWGHSVVPESFNLDRLPGGGPFDGLMSQNELDGVLLNWGSGTPPVLPVPEPTGLALIAWGGFALLRGRSAGAR